MISNEAKLLAQREAIVASFKEKLPDKLTTIENWLENPSLNKGHLANLGNDSQESLWQQERQQKIATLGATLESTEKYRSHGFLTDQEAQDIKIKIDVLIPQVRSIVLPPIN